MAQLETFVKQFKGDVVLPTDPTYDQALDRWAKNAIRRAAVVAFVKDAEDVALAIKYAREVDLRIAIRGGGHSPAGNSSVEGGLVIDLSRYLKHARVDPEKKLIYVQGGAQWKAVDHAAIKHGLAGVGGTVNHTGVGGLSVGGGYGWQSGAHGLVIDNTVQLTIVTADGSILTANETENSDLFWGARGGGSNFGVVTEFVFKLHPQRAKVFAGPLLFTADKCEQVGAFLDAWWPRAKAEEGMVVVMMRGPEGKPVINAFVFYNGSEEDGRKAYKALFDIGPFIDRAGEMPYEEVNGVTNPLAEWGFNYYFKGALLSEKPSSDLNPKTYAHVLQLIDSSPSHTAAVILEYMPHGKINSIPADTAPYRRDLTGNALVLVQWKDNTPEANQTAKQVIYAIADVFPKGQPYGNYSPNGDAAPTSNAVVSDKTKELFREYYPRLQAIKKKYDPEMVFNQWHTIIPA
ncbi:hypothetical protein EUX98_g5642 [Antrodiella citrinella]|uniref:FAD-binding PCMH-type domain-containing protein n=1 Tax=Antrodiella citrinella TaxID=2447956 RepID=A0A4S4MQY3_9APHY|nr:hypothetical protein EUX98_g5642 [Antrodiella citrinella]